MINYSNDIIGIQDTICDFECVVSFQVNADLLAHEVSLQVYRLAGGIGDAPVPLSS